MHLSLTAACALTFSVGAISSMAYTSGAGAQSDSPPEFGSVQWGRKLEPALDAAEASKKPVMLLFQEVPG
jgi:hypothetical protein